MVRLDTASVPAAAAALTEAFFEDSLVVRLCPNRQTRARAILPVFRFSASMSAHYGEAWASSPEMEAVALWLYSDKMACPPWQWLLFGGWDIRRCLGREGYRELNRVSARIDRARDRVAPERYLYLSSLGVRKEYRRQGLAAELVGRRVREAASQGLSTVVETNTPEALAFYRAIGFRVLTGFYTAGLHYYVLIYG